MANILSSMPQIPRSNAIDIPILGHLPYSKYSRARYEFSSTDLKGTVKRKGYISFYNISICIYFFSYF